MHREVKLQKKFCESLREYAMEILNLKKKWSYLQKCSRKEKFEDKYVKDKKYCKVRGHCHFTSEYRGAAHCICNLKYRIPKQILLIFFLHQD